MQYLIWGLALALLLALWFRYGVQLVTLYEYERGLRYRRGRFIEVLGPGQYWYLPLFTRIRKLDLRPRFVSIGGQEVLTADGVTLKISLAAQYEIADPLAATNRAEDYQAALYLELQLALREIIGRAEIDTLLKTRAELGRQLQDLTATKAQDLGLRLAAVNLKDIMFPGKLKEVFAQLVSARQEGLAMLEKARGETAALRSLANAAKMIEANPQLLPLRLVQTLGQTSGNSLVFGMPPPNPAKTAPGAGSS